MFVCSHESHESQEPLESGEVTQLNQLIPWDIYDNGVLFDRTLPEILLQISQDGEILRLF